MDQVPTSQDPVFSKVCFNEPAELIQQLQATSNSYCLFLDIDGTLADFCDNPEQSFIPDDTLAAIKAIQRCQVPIIAVTGRQIQIAQQLFQSMTLPIAGLHGLDIVLDSHTRLSPDLSSIDFDRLKQALQHACTEYPRLLLEDKQHSFALHYRQCPELEPVAHDIMQQLLVSYPQMKLNHGKCVVEILPIQADKGHAIQTILAHLELNSITPIFIGDDITDESGFKAVNAQQGMSIKVGSGPTDAQYRLKDTSAVAAFLAQFHQFLPCRAANNAVTSCTREQYGEETCPN
ncbi:trehalose-phosphatase [Alkanindiges illinoisensis]|uniref:trehalose-phosphatase n=1 Tax=Alkanindiges illinoisensis TaxID=197183 RepID=UPI0006854C23